MENAIIQFLGYVSDGLNDIWYGVILKLPVLEWGIAISLILTPILNIVHFVYGQIGMKGEE